MFIKFLTKIIEDITDLNSVEYSFCKGNECKTVSFSKNVLQTFFSKNIHKFVVHPTTFNGCSHITIKLNYNDSSRTIRYNDVNDLIYSPLPEKKPIFNPTMKRNVSSPYEDTEENKITILNIVDGLFNDVEDNISDSVIGTKKLIYFTVFGEGYTSLLEKLLESIHLYNPEKDFDVLFICHSDVQKNIEAFSIVNEFNAFYMNVPRPLDGIEASMNKMSIFDWENINEYNKIMFLDCDMLCLRNVNTIFDKITESNKFYTVYNPDIPLKSFNSYTHGVYPVSDEKLQELENGNQKPFNAGQFLFINSTKMKEHFSNIRWFMGVWPSSYFFEQCFANRYFCHNFLTKIDVVQNDFKIIIIPEQRDVRKLHSNDTIFIHFAGPPLNSDRKIEYINNYKNAYL